MLDFIGSDGFAPIDFEVEVDVLRDRDGNEVSSDVRRGVYRKDTGDLLATCGRKYQPVQYMSVVEPYLDHLRQEGFELQFREPDQRSLADLKGQKGAFVQLRTSDNGAKMRMNVITGDFINPTGNTSYLDKGPDTAFRELSFISSHDQSLAVRTDNGYKILRCLNGMRSTVFSASTYGKHTTNFNVDGLKAKIAMGLELMSSDAELFQRYASTPLDREGAMKFLKATFCKLANKPTGEENFSEKLLETIVDLFRHEDQTVWGLIQALTYWSTHGELRGGSNDLTARLDRDAKVSKAMKVMPDMLLAA